MLEIAVPFPFRCAAAGAVHSADLIAPHCRGATGQAGSLRFGSASRGGIASVHGVVAHFGFCPLPSRTDSGSRICSTATGELF
jgi:hypothetical protein